MAVSAAQVKELRERTGAGMMECKKALVESDGDIQAAAELLRKSGQAKADKKAGRTAADGLVVIDNDGDRYVVLEANCETDFVAKDENFASFVSLAAKTALSNQASDVEQLMLSSSGPGTLEEARTQLIAKVGENIGIRRFEFVNGAGPVGSYVHTNSKIAAIVELSGGDNELARDIAMHVAASRPAHISAEDVPKDELEKEREILTAQAKQEGKPDNIVEKMVEGRLRKYLAEITLVGQPFIKDPDVAVGKLLEQSDAGVSKFVCYKVGEGIEKKQDNFVQEVMDQVKKKD